MIARTFPLNGHAIGCVSILRELLTRCEVGLTKVGRGAIMALAMCSEEFQM